MRGAFAAQGRAEEAEDERGGDVHQLDGGAGHADEDVDGAGDGEGDALGALQGERLRDELAEEDLEVGDEAEGYDDGDGVGVQELVRGAAGEPRQVREAAEDGFCYGRLAEAAEGQRGEGDAELHGGEELVDVVLEAEGGAGAGAVELDELLDAGLADADEGELGGHKEGVRQDEEGDQASVDEAPFQHNAWLKVYNEGRVVWTQERPAEACSAGRCAATLRILDEDALEGLVDGVLGDEADDLLGDLAALEDEQRGDAADAVAAGRHVVLVDVHLHDLELAAVLLGDSVHDRRERTTRATPCGPEIDQNGGVRLQDLLLELCVAYLCHKLTCHAVISLGSALSTLPAFCQTQHHHRCFHEQNDAQWERDGAITRYARCLWRCGAGEARRCRRGGWRGRFRRREGWYRRPG